MICSLFVFFTVTIHEFIINHRACSKLINKAVPGTIDERVLKLRPKSKVDVVQNHNLCFNSAMAIGCNVPTNMSQNLLEGYHNIEGANNFFIVVWCGVVWCGVVWCGVVWCGVVWCGVVCLDLI